MRLRLTLVMLRGRVEYHGLSRLAIGSSSLTCPDEQMKGYAFARQARVDFIKD